MAPTDQPEDRRPTVFADADLRGARFVRTDLSGAVMRAVDVAGADVDAELDRRFPGRSQRRAADPDGLRAAWAAVERTWAATIARVEAMPAGTVDVCVDGEWSFAQTLRHLVMVTDT